MGQDSPRRSPRQGLSVLTSTHPILLLPQKIVSFLLVRRYEEFAQGNWMLQYLATFIFQNAITKTVSWNAMYSIWSGDWVRGVCPRKLCQLGKKQLVSQLNEGSAMSILFSYSSERNHCEYWSMKRNFKVAICYLQIIPSSVGYCSERNARRCMQCQSNCQMLIQGTQTQTQGTARREMLDLEDDICRSHNLSFHLVLSF